MGVGCLAWRGQASLCRGAAELPSPLRGDRALGVGESVLRQLSPPLTEAHQETWATESCDCPRSPRKTSGSRRTMPGLWETLAGQTARAVSLVRASWPGFRLGRHLSRGGACARDRLRFPARGSGRVVLQRAVSLGPVSLCKEGYPNPLSPAHSLWGPRGTFGDLSVNFTSLSPWDIFIHG